jgi:hypothetical protein
VGYGSPLLVIVLLIIKELLEKSGLHVARFLDYSDLDILIVTLHGYLGKGNVAFQPGTLPDGRGSDRAPA